MKLKETIIKIINNKHIMRLLWVLCLVLFIACFVRYKSYKQAKIYYNKGVENFKEGYYDAAEDYFSYSILYKQKKSFECKSRINYALSITTPITEDSVTDENLDENIARLEEAIDILTAHDCAHQNDSNGHNKKAQKLKEEIEEYIEYLKEKHKSEEKKEEDNGGSDEDKKKQEEEEKRKEEERKAEQNKLKQQFTQIEQEGLNERNQNLELYETWSNDMNITSGKTW